MTRILALAGLLALQIVLCTCGYGYKEGDILTEGSMLRLEGDKVNGKVTKCFVKTSQGNRYELFPNNTSPGNYYGDGQQCCMDARDITLSYAGTWIMETIVGSEKFEKQWAVTMKQKGIVRPSSYIPSSQGQWATIWLDDSARDLTVCKLSNQKSGIHDLLKDKVANMSRTNGCGVRMLVGPKMAGQWELTARIGKYLMKSAIFQINIPYEHPEDENKMRKATWEIGKHGTMELQDLGSLFCQITKPDGVKLPIIFGSCSYEVPAVSLHHRGVWNVSYAKTEKLELNYVLINVTTTDPNLLESSVTQNGNELNLMCQTGVKQLKFCTYIRPDKFVFNVPAGLGNNKYSYYGKGFQERYSSNRMYGECGLTIREPTAEDFGMWTCEMGIDGTIRGAVIDVARPRAGGVVRKIEGPKVYVKRGDKFKIQCSTNAVLNYCWLTSPNGTAFTVSPTEGASNALKYDGKGFSMGECGAIVKKANDSDNGEWTCHLGIDKDTAELEGIVTVKVTDTYLIPTEDTVYVQPRPKLSCRTFATEEGTLEYCRWVRPNGHGINKEDVSRYDLQKGTNECSVTILDLKPEDIGQWQCVAALSRSSSSEEWATVDLRTTADSGMKIASILSIVLGSGLLIIALIGAFFGSMYFYKRRNARIIKNPPPYYPQDYNIPHGIQTGPESENEKKNYVF